MTKRTINTPLAPIAIGPYSQAVSKNNWIIVSGQLPVNPQTNQIEVSDIKGQTEQALKNIQSILEAGGFTLADVVKCTVYLSVMSLFSAMNEVYALFFQQPFPARAAVAVKELPRQALIEMEAMAIR
jgi:2-iminobutanoate/2-iminopropanoate deaminase